MSDDAKRGLFIMAAAIVIMGLSFLAGGLFDVVSEKNDTEAAVEITNLLPDTEYTLTTFVTDKNGNVVDESVKAVTNEKGKGKAQKHDTKDTKEPQTEVDENGNMIINIQIDNIENIKNFNINELIDEALEKEQKGNNDEK